MLMDRLVAFFKNVWFRRGIAVVSWAYTILLCRVAFLCFGYSFQYENATALFVLYLFINIAALGLLILTRKQVITMINCFVLPPVVFLILLFGFGHWYIVFPPLAVMVAMFFINASNETLKTILGTMYLLMFVIGTAGYIAISLFMSDITFTGVDVSLRDGGYEILSDSGDYRVVRYIDKPGERRTASYYVEYTRDDVELPFAVCKKVFGCKHLHTASFTSKSDDPIRWGVDPTTKEEILYVDGIRRENPYLTKETDTSGVTASTVTTAATSAVSDTTEQSDANAE